MDSLTLDDQQKLSLLYDLHEQRLYHIAFSVLQDVAQAEDVTQDCFVKIAGMLSQIEDCNSDKTKFLLMRMAKNLAIDRYRKQKRQCSFGEELDILPAKENIEQHTLQKHLLQFLLSGLDTPSREIIKLRCFYDLSYKEIASRLAIGEDAAMKRFQRAKEKVKQLKGAYDDEPISRP